MLIKTDNITESGLEIKSCQSAKWVTNIPEIFNGTRELSLNKNIEIDCKATKVLKEINVNGLIRFGIKTFCHKCLKEVKLDLQADVNMTLTPKNESEDHQADIDYEFYGGKSIDLSGYFREQIAMNIPYRVICKEVCKGLCSKCGADLNVEECECKRDLEKSTFAVLKNIKI